jgi:hypothetical protein
VDGAAVTETGPNNNKTPLMNTGLASPSPPSGPAKEISGMTQELQNTPDPLVDVDPLSSSTGGNTNTKNVGKTKNKKNKKKQKKTKKNKKKIKK